MKGPNMKGMPPAPSGRPPKRKFSMSTFKRVIKILFESYPKLLPITLGCIIFSSLISTIPAIFNQQVIAVIEEWYKTKDWAGASEVIIPKLTILAILYLLSFS